MDGNRSFPNSNDESKDKKQHDCLDDLQFFQLIEGHLPQKKRQDIFSHLNSCKKCFSTLMSLGKIRPYLYHSSGKEAYLRKKSLSQKQQVDLILKYIESDQQKSTDKNMAESSALQFPGFREKIRLRKHIPRISWFYSSLREALFARILVVKVQTSTLLTFIVFTALLIAAGVFFIDNYLPGLQFNRTISKINIYPGYGKLSGSFGLKRSRGVLSRSKASTSPGNEHIVEAQTLAREILGSENVSAGFLHKYLQLLIIASDFATADSILHVIQDKKIIIQSAGFLNDIGVLYFLKALKDGTQNFDIAEGYFQKAKNLNPQYKDAYFNLALIRIEQNNQESANSFLDRYIEFETDKDWRLAAKDLKQNK